MLFIFFAIGIFLIIFFIGRPFYNLAGFHYKNKWVFGILGIVSYYVGVLLGAFLFGLISELISPGSVSRIHATVVTLVAFASGVIICLIFYRVLKSKWEADENKPFGDDTVLDSYFNNQ